MHPLKHHWVAWLPALLGVTASSTDERYRFEYDDDVVAPARNFDPNTIKSCSFWDDNFDGKPCEYIRRVSGVKPEDFTRWNPSVTLDCGNWNLDYSYCVEVNTEWTTTLTGPPQTGTSSTRTASATTTSPTPPMGSPRWEPLGCYKDDERPEWPAMPKLVTPDGGDSDLTIEKCQQMCFDDDWEVDAAGVEAGNECWCGSRVSNYPADNVTDCNTPCGGDSAQMCGGKGFIFAYVSNYSHDASDAPVCSGGECLASTSSSASDGSLASTSSSANNGKEQPTMVVETSSGTKETEAPRASDEPARQDKEGSARRLMTSDTRIMAVLMIGTYGVLWS